MRSKDGLRLQFNGKIDKKTEDDKRVEQQRERKRRQEFAR